MFDCISHFRLSETPHVESIEVTDGGTGYTTATAKVIGGGGRGARLRCVIVDGVITEIIVTHPGRGFTSQPTIEITGDGSGATAEPNMAGGSEIYQNTTQVQDYHLKECDDYACAVDENGDPVAVEDRPDICLIDPVIQPICSCGDHAASCDACVEVEPTIPVENTFEAYDPPQYADYSLCKKRGFKVVFAVAPWAGNRGYTDCGDYKALSQTKYLTETYEHTYTEDIYECPEGAENCGAFVATVTRSYTRVTTKSRFGGPDVVSVSGTELDGEGVPQDFATTFPNDLPTTAIPAGNCEEYHTTTCGEDFEASATHDQTNTERVDTYTLDACSFAVPECAPESGRSSWTETVRYTLSDENTAADVNAMADSLLDEWDLCDDIQIPWRTDADVWQGPLVTYGYQDDGSWGIIGSPTPNYVQQYWASNFINYEKELSCSDPESNVCWRSKSAGRWLTDHKTWEMPDRAEGQIPPGANAFYNNSRFFTLPCNSGGWDDALFPGALLKSKWAETYLFEFPHHNDARPCGDDATTRDPDTINCDEGDPNYNPTGDIRWPDAPATCDPASVPKEGSYSVKSFFYRPMRAVTFNGLVDGTPITDDCGNAVTPQESGGFDVDADLGDLDSMSCTPGNMTLSCQNAVFIQQSPPTGAYENALHIEGPGDIRLEDCFEIGSYPNAGECENFRGEWKLVQFQQAMIDPLWKQPASCVDGEKVNDEDAFVPLEENTDCEGCPGSCDCDSYNNDSGYTVNDKCEWSTLKPWLDDYTIVV